MKWGHAFRKVSYGKCSMQVQVLHILHHLVIWKKFERCLCVSAKEDELKCYQYMVHGATYFVGKCFHIELITQRTIRTPDTVIYYFVRWGIFGSPIYLSRSRSLACHSSYYFPIKLYANNSMNRCECDYIFNWISWFWIQLQLLPYHGTSYHIYIPHFIIAREKDWIEEWKCMKCVA